MGEKELKAALRRDMETRVQQLWHQSEAEVEARRREVEAELGRVRKQADDRLAATVQAERNAILFAAQQQADRCRLKAEAAVAERLRQLALAMLPGLGEQDRTEIWGRLLDELPDADWQLVRVHPADVNLAQRALPAARIETTDALGGGLVVELDDGRVLIDNSLQKRLERCWLELLPLLMAEFRSLVESNGPVESDRTE